VGRLAAQWFAAQWFAAPWFAALGVVARGIGGLLVTGGPAVPAVPVGH